MLPAEPANDLGLSPEEADSTRWAEEILAERQQRTRGPRGFGGTVVNSFARGVGWTLGRDFVNGILSALGLRR